jgi:hypothetical protein
MCVLVVAFRVLPGTPLLIGANRDEVVDRPAVSMTVLSDRAPRILGGRDGQSGGTWLAVSEFGVFAGLTNQPLGDGRDPTRRSRGELPLAVTSHDDARSGVEALLADHRPSDYNGSWMLAGDRDALYFVDFTGTVAPEAVALAPGLYVLENRPLGAPSPKADRIRHILGGLDDLEAALGRLRLVLADHTGTGGDAAEGEPKSSANCVHLDGYGTRSACIVRHPEDPGDRPQVWVADGPPCTAPFVDVSHLWTTPPPGR